MENENYKNYKKVCAYCFRGYNDEEKTSCNFCKKELYTPQEYEIYLKGYGRAIKDSRRYKTGFSLEMDTEVLLDMYIELKQCKQSSGYTSGGPDCSPTEYEPTFFIKTPDDEKIRINQVDIILFLEELLSEEMTDAVEEW